MPAESLQPADSVDGVNDPDVVVEVRDRFAPAMPAIERDWDAVQRWNRRNTILKACAESS